MHCRREALSKTPLYMKLGVFSYTVAKMAEATDPAAG